MKIEVITLSDKGMEEFDFRQMLTIKVDGKTVFNVMDGEPEDANLMRDFNDCLAIPELMEMAFNAGKQGDEISIERVEVDDPL